MDTILPYALLCFTSFFTLTNPLGTMPVFLTMTNGLEEKERQHIVKRATIISFIILIAFTFCGQFLFKFFGISTNGFRIAAGIIILKIGYDMLQARYTNTKLKDEEIKAYANDISITPLSIPMLCGPGAIANGTNKANSSDFGTCGNTYCSETDTFASTAAGSTKIRYSMFTTLRADGPEAMRRTISSRCARPDRKSVV